MLSLKLSQLNELVRFQSVSIASLLIDGMQCGTPIYRGKNELSHEMSLLPFQGHLRKVLQGFLCNYIYSQVALVFYK
jgi:hypothetical protein